jgi:AraC-like DNA-binding protein
MQMILYIKNMVCIRCKMGVKSELEKLGIYEAIIDMGEVRIRGGITSQQRERLNISLKKAGFELVDEEKGMLYEKIKKIVVELVHYIDEEQLKINLHDYLSKKLKRDYAWLDNLFFEIKNITIEMFFINHKIEKVKELLVYYKIDLPEIAFQLNYSGAGQLSSQFKDVTGFSPSHFQEMRTIRHNTQIDV